MFLRQALIRLPKVCSMQVTSLTLWRYYRTHFDKKLSLVRLYALYSAQLAVELGVNRLVCAVLLALSRDLRYDNV